MASARAESAVTGRPVGLLHRDDIQGLRAIAVLLVVLAHAGVKFLKGGFVGVDVFFVLSGFLITGLLLSGAARNGRVLFTDFYARRARRILPAAALTLVVTDIVAYRLLNFVRAKEAVSDSIWASFFAANVRFAQKGTDYFARAQPPSSIQHYWSLAVEEQFYLVWPTLLSLVVFGRVLARTRRRNRDPDAAIGETALRRLLVFILLAAAVSFAWSIHSTDRTPAAAYFSTLTRAWELALGAALAVGAATLARVPAGLRRTTGWIGVAFIACAAIFFSDSTPFPGYAALLPTVGTALVIAAGLGQQRSGAAGALLSVAPLRYVGDRSYAFYLWHWPVLIIAIQYEGDELSTGVKLLLAGGAFLLSVVSYRFFENPLRRASWGGARTALVLWPASIATVLIVATLNLHLINAKSLRLAEASAAISSSRQHVDTPSTLPSVVAAVKAAQRGASIPSALIPPLGSLLSAEYAPGDCAAHGGQTRSSICPLGDPTSTKVVLVVGDSHAFMWMPAVLRLARQDGWRAILLAKSACTPDTWTAHQIQPRTYPGAPSWGECHTWFQWALGQAKALRPTVILISAAACCSGPADAPVVTGISAATVAMKRLSKAVVVMQDTPRLQKQPVDCLLAHGATMNTCTIRIPQDTWQISDHVAAAVKKRGGAFLRTQGWFCYESQCPMVVGHTIVYTDGEHVTTSYAEEVPFRAAFDAAILNQLTH